MDPVILCISLFGSFTAYAILKRGARAREFLLPLVIIPVSAVINPVFSHNGVTVLFIINDTPITLESTLYGAGIGVMISAVIYWFKSFTVIMTSDRLLYVCSAVSPRLALVFSMAIRYVPLLIRQREEVRGAQRIMGRYKTRELPQKIASSSRVFSVMVTWALENGVVTADSMSARGYGAGRRTHFYVFSFKMQDALFVVACLILGCMIFIPMATGAMGFEYYPEIYMSKGILSVMGYIAFVCLTLLPCGLYILEELKWKYLERKI
ncbi:MAG: energy-coupling factor transporter transmembrane protein EcfT [Clostridiales bacterium]|nr:energy-coupling factor transporter transmembrane protein EcfT [Clostridiales bacterium]